MNKYWVYYDVWDESSLGYTGTEMCCYAASPEEAALIVKEREGEIMGGISYIEQWVEKTDKVGRPYVQIKKFGV